jgi:hypothetical protein
MNAKQKANEIANRFVTKSVFDMTNEELKQERLLAKKHALVCVDEILKAVTTIADKKYDFYIEVKTGIEALP